MANTEEIQKSYYAVIPANVRYDQDLMPNAKLLFGEISALCNEKGFSWASNQYFAELYSVSDRQVRRWIKELADKGYIYIEYHNQNTLSEKRYIHITPWTIPQEHMDKKVHRGQKSPRGRTKKSETPDKKVHQNNTYNNTFNKYIEQMDLLWTLYPNKKGKDRAYKKLPKLIEQYGYEQLVRCIERYKRDLEKDTWREAQNGSTFFNSGCIDYLDCNFEESTKEMQVVQDELYEDPETGEIIKR